MTDPNMKQSPLACVASFLKEQGIYDTHIVCALSGGADSMVLLWCLWHLKEEFALRLSALHINHGIRGEEAERDEAFCRTYCEQYEIPFIVHFVDVPKLAQEEKLSLETAARKARYEIFASVLEQVDDTYLATAHNATDNAETILFRMARGTALRGLCGIPPKRERVSRPLLRVFGEDIRTWANHNGVPYVEDSTNGEVAYTRNFVRHEVLPRLESVHEGAISHISCMVEHLAEDEEYLVLEAKKLLERCQGKGLRSKLATAPKPLAYRAIRLLYEEVQLSKDALTSEQLSDILALASRGAKNAQMTVPAGVVLNLEGNELYFSVGDEPAEPPLLKVGFGEQVLPERDGILIISRSPIGVDTFPSLNIYRKLIYSSVNSATIVGDLYVRSKQDGDAYRYGGMTHKLKRMFNDMKLSLSERRKWPLLCDDKGIVWVPGFGTRDTGGQEHGDKIYFCYGYQREATR